MFHFLQDLYDAHEGLSRKVHSVLVIYHYSLCEVKFV